MSKADFEVHAHHKHSPQKKIYPRTIFWAASLPDMKPSRACFFPLFWLSNTSEDELNDFFKIHAFFVSVDFWIVSLTCSIETIQIFNETTINITFCLHRSKNISFLFFKHKFWNKEFQKLLLFFLWVVSNSRNLCSHLPSVFSCSNAFRTWVHLGYSLATCQSIFLWMNSHNIDN